MRRSTGCIRATSGSPRSCNLYSGPQPMSYVHLRRYGKKPGAAEVAAVDIIGDGQVVYKGHRYDLRTAEKGAKQPGFAHQVDGRFLQWNQADGTLDVHHGDGRVAPVHVVGGKPIGFLGDYLVYNDDSR